MHDRRLNLDAGSSQLEADVPSHGLNVLTASVALGLRQGRLILPCNYAKMSLVFFNFSSRTHARPN